MASLTVTFINWARAKFHHPGLWLTNTVVVICAVGMLLPTAMRGIKFQGIPSFYLRYLGLGVILVVVAAWQGEGGREGNGFMHASMQVCCAHASRPAACAD